MTTSTREFLSVEEVAQELRLSETQVRRLYSRATDPLPVYRFGAIRIDRTDLDAWISRQRKGATR